MMAEPDRDGRLQRRRDVADMMCSGHAWLRDRFSRWAKALDAAVLLLSAWVTVLGLADPDLAGSLAPMSLAPTLWAGCLGAATFGLVLLQTRLDWRSSADQHARAFDLYFEIRNAADAAILDEAMADRLMRLEAARPLVIPIPDRLFLPVKQRHLRKVALSHAIRATPFALRPALALRRMVAETWLALRQPGSTE